ncbi:hypothetical protein TNCV_4040451 [Trichonephila clavipes]|nr:hypothetical protein TNCV_4040451 [Trichonephila clavipes]
MIVFHYITHDGPNVQVTRTTLEREPRSSSVVFPNFPSPRVMHNFRKIASESRKSKTFNSASISKAYLHCHGLFSDPQTRLLCKKFDESSVPLF